MQFIDLVKALRRECGVSGTDATVTGATGEWARLVNWTAQAYTEIQMENTDWQWMRKSKTFNTVANQGEYDLTADLALTDFADWREKSFRVYLTLGRHG